MSCENVIVIVTRGTIMSYELPPAASQLKILMQSILHTSLARVLEWLILINIGVLELKVEVIQVIVI